MNLIWDQNLGRLIDLKTEKDLVSDDVESGTRCNHNFTAATGLVLVTVL